ncbi:hypothetical protein DCD74_02215 [Lysobacter oculi]|uniref:SMODS-associating 2TM beta-strand rich effector domain-containing protein n=1 Tax=Solilutibacter oculi TaxID=2698682 RepID=A0A344J3P9_9GAMM|nr:hypothetical protein [Lysobacter oculi]AXA83659.1 hypothetical protein DCD74_02215 [Lysobacter oculi]
MEALAVGIIAGLIASGLALFFHKIYLRIIRPWYEERVYKDTEIEGRWKITYQNVEDLTEEIVTLSRVAHAVSGTILVTKGPDNGKTYSLSGEFKNSLLTAVYSSADKLALDRGAFVLQLISNGYGFKGQCSYYHDDHQIISREVTWTRVGS